MSETTGKSSPYQTILVAGGGSWGTALASLTARAGMATTLWARNDQVVSAINGSRENSIYLPGIKLPETLGATTDLAAALENADAVIFVIPAQYARDNLAEMRRLTGGKTLPVALCCKGIERGTGALMTEVIADAWPEAIPAILSGPSFAADVARGLPTAVTLACADKSSGERWAQTIKAPHFRPYLTADMIGAELGGAVKNVLAIACGVVEGKGLGESARAALIARGFAEFQRLGVALGAEAQTMAGLSGLGDLILTCSSRQSRNMSLGYEIGEGRTAKEIIAERQTVSEGAASAGPLMKLAGAAGVDMPICAAVADLVDGRTGVDQAILGLLARPLRNEGSPAE
ncbi:NAD(P)H-dependent glycerol-3-phosphate dehydrogenase [Aquisalinus flavus]|uniref:Glycerol-3-phosphate dehydrogenase [NAD(P)+] n=1 Tax=Aquisalinus flavus TaxID=1526572 RepID=A0A8J2V3R2_9PROT|nr:NAD(P)H-dependent glycerol-3-phosphate dehydrogenase [Aquisalinus flavus]MBD0425514.1 NAD(P)-dependent glycerol-3-phosphate dehydrogenase [Aquisalinus flavus]UNE48855.1 NAD(P)-dependent glycerol-3-phosphate dehydrogenase [Aquisalinus flavus]GGD15474.1 glycerol-3-phosphate dehydrogenase [NAD(P)+] [Aquisalinus flavus]